MTIGYYPRFEANDRNGSRTGNAGGILYSTSAALPYPYRESGLGARGRRARARAPRLHVVRLLARHADGHL